VVRGEPKQSRGSSVIPFPQKKPPIASSVLASKSRKGRGLLAGVVAWWWWVAASALRLRLRARGNGGEIFGFSGAAALVSRQKPPPLHPRAPPPRRRAPHSTAEPRPKPPNRGRDGLNGAAL